MANEEHLELIKQGVDTWNRWREEHADTRPDLKEANLSRANLITTNLSEADLSRANLIGTDLIKAHLYRANLSGADLTGVRLVETNLENADLNGCRIYGISAWNIKVDQETNQSDLIITQPDEATVKVDDIQVAQFIYLLRNNQKSGK